MVSDMEPKLAIVSVGVVLSTVSLAERQPLKPSPNWAEALPPGPDTNVKITEEYAKSVGRDAYFWAWPMVNIYNRRLSFVPIKESARSGPLILAPLNRLITSRC